MNRIGRYKIVRELGRGAMGVVYLATDPAIGRSVAIKVIRLHEVDEPAQRAKLRERLSREARSAGLLSHPNLVTVFDMDEEDGTAFIAMEYVNGPTLDAVMHNGKAMPAARLFSILSETAAGLDYAHRKGIIHRDIKPANIMLDEAGRVKISDFGIAKVSAGDSHTQTGAIVGTPNYMSPEQVQGIAIDGRSDQFSLAVIAYEILTGERPFSGEHLTTVVYKIVAQEPIPPQRINPTLSPQIDSVIRKALSKKPEQRYPSCSAFVAALQAACDAVRSWRAIAPGGAGALDTLAEPVLPKPPARATAQTADHSPARIKRSRAAKAAEATPSGRGNKVALLETGGAVATRRKKRSAVPFILAFAVTLGALALITWRMDQGLALHPSQPAATLPARHEAVPEPPPEAVRQPEPAAEQKPSPLAGDTAAFAPPVGNPVASPAGAPPQDVNIATNPGGATASINGSPALTCSTPCTLAVPPGTHTLAVTLPGYGTERRDLHVESEPQDVPLIMLRRQSGTLMLSSVPSGAAIYIDGKLQPSLTPAPLPLSAGTYKVTVEKDGQRASETVELRGNDTSYLKLTLRH